ncbi:hypothetical protein BF17_21120 [Yersinia similis]|uniref:Lipoprotein n=1 Tax=Yersinia similis TaxID=367190 RepID=A0ABM5Q2J4_9GAMM|nr:hypothetical protein [Yersinia similis]AHK21491.1 hypothetical protein BF17_21120 [Yersinia similis]CFQ62899.1 Uncharacterised protein [Yersinia similis]
MKIILFSSVFLISFIISGCSSSWEPIGQAPLTLEATKSLCNSESLIRFPIKNEVAQRTIQQTVTIKCKTGEECSKNGGYKYENKSVLESYPMDVNKQSRNANFSDCMGKNGWQRETKWF